LLTDFQILKELDLGNFDSVRKFATDVTKEYPKIHLLVNNAGIMINDGKIHKQDNGDLELHMTVNHLGPFLLTNLLLENIKNAAPSRFNNVFNFCNHSLS